MRGRFKKAAFYLITHGPYKRPRFIDLQYLRIKRAKPIIEKERDVFFEEEEVYVDLNYDRQVIGGNLGGLNRLLEDAEKEKQPFAFQQFYNYNFISQ